MRDFPDEYCKVLKSNRYMYQTHSSQSLMKILITTPNLEKQGGVVTYIRTLKEHFSVSVDYFIVGARTSGEGPLASLKRFSKDNWNFHKKLRENNYDIVHLNPSLGTKSYLQSSVIATKTIPSACANVNLSFRYLRDLFILSERDCCDK